MGKQKNANVDWEAAKRLSRVMADLGWVPRDVQAASCKSGHPNRFASQRVVYRVLNEGHRPTNPIQFEIAAAVGLRPSHIWGDTPIPETLAPLPAQAA
jgi:hypothetical protein